MAKTSKDSSLNEENDIDEFDSFDGNEEIIPNETLISSNDVRRKIDDLLERKKLRDEFGDIDLDF